MPHNEQGKTNVLSMFGLVNLDFRFEWTLQWKTNFLLKKTVKLECLNPVMTDCVIMIVKTKNVSFQAVAKKISKEKVSEK